MMTTTQKLADAYKARDALELQMRRSKAYIALLKRQLAQEEGWGAIPRDERVRDMVRNGKRPSPTTQTLWPMSQARGRWPKAWALSIGPVAMARLPFWERYDAIRATVAGNWRKRYPLTARRLYLLTFASGVIAAAIGAVADGVEAGEHERVG